MEHKQEEEEIKKQLFIEALKATYKREYGRVQPIPYIKDKLYSVDKVFVEGGVQFMDTDGASRGRESWERLASYKDIFSDARVSSMRRIFEGEPGYGKTTLTLQLAHDWCQNARNSPLRDVEILIMLRLRQLGGVRSIYRAISVYLVAAERKLRDKDVAEIIRNSSSVVVILDGYDEYPDRNNKRENDVQKVLMMTMFEQMQIILTTRYLPQNYSDNTKIIRLTGFDEIARDQYIRKAVVGEQDVRGLHSIKRTLKENPVVNDLCQVPLIFVMYAHMANTDPDFENFKTVTSFFKHMISCFHAHLRNKASEPNTKRFLIHENKHEALDQLAFSGLSRENQQISWDKNELCDKLGVKFYDVYVSIGILIEEEMICSTGTENDMHSTTEVRFYHKLFCEWYAAHYLGETLSQPRQDHSIDELLCYMDPTDLQYVYRFACGINADAGKKLINYLNTKGDMDRFAILCILERAGNVEDILPAVREICSKTVTIYQSFNRLQQRSNQQLLDIASTYNVPIQKLQLLEMFDSIDKRKQAIVAYGDCTIPALQTLRRLEISNSNVPRSKLIGLLEYAQWCPGLIALRFLGCEPPEKIDPGTIPPSIKQRRLTVAQNANYGDPDEVLNLETGKWEAGDKSRQQLETLGLTSWR